VEALSPYEEKKWDEHKRMLDSQTNRVKIFESPDGGKTIYERYFGESNRRLVEPAKSSAEVEMHNSEEDKKSPFVQYGKDEHEVFLTEDAFGQIISTQNEEPMELVTGTLMDFEITDTDDDMYNPEDGMIGEPEEYDDGEEDAFMHDEPSEEEEEKWWVEKGMVDHPPHYNKGIETSEYIRSWDMNWDQANIIKYVTRYNLKHVDKDLQCQDLRKARHYLDRLIESYEDDK
jgi:hypothetical protein